MSEYTPSMWSDIDAAIEHAERCRRRQDLAPLFKAVSDTLDEYLYRVHGIQASWAHPGEFVRWLTEHGILPVDAGELAAYGRSIVEAGEREAEQIVALTERAEAAERRLEEALALLREEAEVDSGLPTDLPQSWFDRREVLLAAPVSPPEEAL